MSSNSHILTTLFLLHIGLCAKCAGGGKKSLMCEYSLTSCCAHPSRSTYHFDFVVTFLVSVRLMLSYYLTPLKLFLLELYVNFSHGTITMSI